MITYDLKMSLIQIAIRLFVCVVLIVAAVAKIQLAPAILQDGSLLSIPWLLFSAVIIEFAVATFALVAPSPFAWTAITVLFLALTAFATSAIFSNRECNCFGNLLPSGSSLPINFVVVLVMLLNRKHWGTGQTHTKVL